MSYNTSEDLKVDNNSNKNDWAKDTINQLLFDGIKEQRSKRRWGIFFKTLTWSYILLVTLFAYVSDLNILKSDANKEHTAVIEVMGEISKDHPANADSINKALKNAFAHQQTKGVVLKINSPGGSPVQARQIYNNIIKLRADHPKIKVYAAIEDLGTSAAYLIASAADQIYADETSLVGSIGVIINSFGFVDTLKKLGIERRIYTAGKNKAMLDPFSPKNPEHEQFINKQLELTHKLFIKNVLDRRPQIAANPEHEELLSGKFWIGQAAMELGLIDAFGDVRYIADKVVLAPEIKDFTLQPNFMDRINHKFKSMVKSIVFEYFFDRKQA